MNTNCTPINTRQLCFFAAFVLPVGKLLQLPSLLTRYAGGDLLISALAGLLLEFLAFASLVAFAKRANCAPVEFLTNKWGNFAARFFCAVYAVFMLLFTALPLFDLEKFSHAAFSDTSPTFFIFTPFFFLSGYVAVNGLKGVGRSADLSPILLLIPLLGLFVFSVGQADFSRLLPVVEKPLTTTLQATWKTLPYFSGSALCLPIFGGYRYERGAEKRLLPAFGAGAFLTVVFLGVFFSLFGPLGEKEQFAVMKIGQYFPALKSIGRVDLLLVYLITILLFYYTALPSLFFTEFLAQAFGIKSKLWVSVALSVTLYLCALFLNKYYVAIHTFFSSWLPPVFLVFGTLIPIGLGVLTAKNGGGRYAFTDKPHPKKEQENAV